MENELERNMENEMETGIVQWLRGIILNKYLYCFKVGLRHPKPQFLQRIWDHDISNWLGPYVTCMASGAYTPLLNVDPAQAPL